MESYDLPNNIVIDCAVTNAAGVAVDPTAVLCIVTRPDGQELGYYYGSLSDQGSWNPSTNTPTLANGTGTAGQRYTASAAGTVNFGSGQVTFAAGDWVVYNGKGWRRLPGSPAPAAPANSVTRESAGNYRLVQYADIPETWVRRWETVGTIAGDGGKFYLRRAGE